MTEARHRNAIRTVLFDLDGTLADTAPDLAHALNLLLAEHGRQALSVDQVRPEASHGSIALIRLGFGLEPEHPEFEPLRRRFLALYADHICEHTRLFPGMNQVLDGLTEQGLNWGVVTNKPARLTEPLLERLGLAAEAACIVSGDTTDNRKPHPAPMLYACRRAGSEPAQCLYVGDAERDIAAGREAGMPTLVALYGYIGGHERPQDWGASGMIRAPLEVLSWLDGTPREGPHDA